MLWLETNSVISETEETIKTLNTLNKKANTIKRNILNDILLNTSYAIRQKNKSIATGINNNMDNIIVKNSELDKDIHHSRRLVSNNT